MSTFLLHVHGFLPYLFVILMLVTLAMGVSSLNAGTFSLRQKLLARIVLILAHVQLIFGLAVLFLGDSARGAFATGMSTIMKTPELRLKFVEHPSMMIIAIALITIGFARAKRTTDSKTKNKNILIFYGLGFLLILSRIPYAAWFNL